MSDNKEINVDKAWNKIYSRIKDNELIRDPAVMPDSYRIRTILKIAATVLIVIGLASSAIYLGNSGMFSKKMIVATNSDQRNVEVSLPDGSIVFLNRNSEISYRSYSGRTTRNVSLKGEAFFEITPDESKPFIIDAGKANIKVLGTSFNVITNNSNNLVEVFVKTGKVMLSDSSGSQNLILEPGNVGTMDSGIATKTINTNQNYMSWQTDTLVYEGQKLEVVFSDLKRVHNIDIVVDNPEILEKTITTTFDNQPQDTIIQVICSTFNFSYEKDGYVYHLSKK